jgi:hypothetical protein
MRYGSEVAMLLANFFGRDEFFQLLFETGLLGDMSRRKAGDFCRRGAEGTLGDIILQKKNREGQKRDGRKYF